MIIGDSPSKKKSYFVFESRDESLTLFEFPAAFGWKLADDPSCIEVLPNLSTISTPVACLKTNPSTAISLVS